MIVMQNIIFQASNIELTAETKDYISKRLKKFANLIDTATNVTVNITHINPSNKGGESYKVEITIKMPKAFIKVEDRGPVINSVVDILDIPLKRRLERYRNKYKRWEKGESWKSLELNSLVSSEPDSSQVDYQDYLPAIKRKYYEEDRPLHPAEAIEQMELLGHNCFLFKNIESNKYAMIYKRRNGGYGLIEPQS